MKTLRPFVSVVATVLLGLSATAAQAGIITITFEGQITSSDVAILFFSPSTGSIVDETPFPVGTNITGSFVFSDRLQDTDPSENLSDFSSSAGSANVEGLRQISAQFTIPGGRGGSFGAGPFSTFSIPLGLASPQFGLRLLDTADQDEFGISLSARGDPIFLETFSLGLSLVDTFGTLFAGSGGLTGEPQDVLDLLGDGSFSLDPLIGSFQYQRVPRLSRQELAGQFSVTSLQISTTSVPSPGSFSLLCLGFLFLFRWSLPTNMLAVEEVN